MHAYLCLNLSCKQTIYIKPVGCYCLYDPNIIMYLHNILVKPNNIRLFAVIICIQNVKQLRVNKKQSCTLQYVTGAKTFENSWDAQNSHL